jgi:hypothetical protein
MKKDENEHDRHESYGLLSICRTEGGDCVLFGSDLRHRQRIILRITRARTHRQLAADWHYEDGPPLIEVEMSPVQWATAISTMNVGPGTPCTLRTVGGHDMAEPPARQEKEAIRAELKEALKGVLGLLEDGMAQAKALLDNPRPTKGDRTALLAVLSRLRQNLASNIPFIHTQFERAMGKTVAEAKGEVEAYVLRTIIESGLAALKGQTAPVGLLEDKSDAEAE